uniref:uracil phosphoribosyltransferase n=1 Tax=Helicotheca tamesis TaxID=374047 RepID=A0A7S2MFT6_9STRA|eukprot:CAMPEP_0185728328 /NCGR_PEP_ID=MMETSP1171-20130828/3705_1 /TAXON_ID=374046 /ORGANISM="Helicotheca tamensis, Strain CCMP826" /LENGTH=244 /DNA_ID=CAMNT_0028397023 /DNA_START=85 /DNA_END=819 /DNA_ORIENTATION=-
MSTSETTVEPSFCAPLPNVHVSTHPVLHDKISILRSSSTTPASFRSVLRDITFHLGYEATATLTTRPIALTVPVGHDHIECKGKKLNERVALIPILRSGLGMTDPMLELIPKAEVHHIGMYRQNLMPVQYYNRLPRKCESDIAFVVDPLIATAQTLVSVVAMLKKWGVPKIHVISVIASKPGLEEFLKSHPDVLVTVGHVDDELRDDGTIIPGLGDAGDRLFGTPMLDDDEALLHPSKRKRSDA